MQFPLYHLLPGKLEMEDLEFHLFVVAVVVSPNLNKRCQVSGFPLKY